MLLKFGKHILTILAYYLLFSVTFLLASLLSTTLLRYLFTSFTHSRYLKSSFWAAVFLTIYWFLDAKALLLLLCYLICTLNIHRIIYLCYFRFFHYSPLAIKKSYLLIRQLFSSFHYILQSKLTSSTAMTTLSPARKNFGGVKHFSDLSALAFSCLR